MHRFKGLEYQQMILGWVAAGSIPAARVEALKAADPERYEREVKRARSLLFVAATRARDALVITWSGQPSPFLPPATPALPGQLRRAGRGRRAVRSRASGERVPRR
jgi:superfamily I DNA/RNA helicase